MTGSNLLKKSMIHDSSGLRMRSDLTKTMKVVVVSAFNFNCVLSSVGAYLTRRFQPMRRWSPRCGKLNDPQGRFQKA
jgi:hypothetical protein